MPAPVPARPAAPVALDLGGAWTLTEEGGGAPIAATVPGCVHADLQAAGRLPPLFWRDNELQHFWPGERDWTYERSVEVPAGLLARDRVVLRCDGLDTLATVEVNGVAVITADNMFRSWEADVKVALRPGANTVRVRFRSPLPVMERRSAEHRLPAWNIYHPRYAGKSWVRKMACSFGWDWGPMAPTAGIWKPIRLLAWSQGRLADVRTVQRHADGRVTVAVSAAVERFAADALRVRATLAVDGATVATAEGDAGAALELAVADPRLWWPNGLGAQPLYDLRVELLAADGTVVDTHAKRLGLRTLRLVRERDQWGESFAFAVNGVRIFAKGANWIPCDVFPSQIPRATYDDLLGAAAESGMNMLRVWGGGFYEHDAFYDRCDELGLLVWQDFMFACSTYPTFDAEWLATVRAEAVENVRRLRDRPCLALWCGNNELEQGLVDNEWTERAMSWADYAVLFDRLLPGIVASEDGATPYWPCSPHSPHGDRRDFNNHRWGDAHAWSVWFGGQSFESQRTWTFRFQSEFGFQSFPEPRTVAAFTAPEDRNLTSYVMDLHQRSKQLGNKTIFGYLLEWFRMPKDFAHQLWLSQLTQALCIQYAAEHARRIQPRMEGCIYWQINDLWPAATWSSIDVFGRWKALQHLARRFFAPVLVSGLEDLKAGTVAVHVSNHRREPLRATVEWRATDCAGTELARGTAPVAVPGQADVEACVVAADGLRRRLGDQLVHGDIPHANGTPGMYRGDLDLLIWLRVIEGGRELSRNLVLFARPKHLQLRAPAIAATVAAAGDGAFAITLAARHPALWTRLELDDEDARFSDNWLHLDGGAPVTVECRPKRTLTLEDIRTKLRVESLIDAG